MKKKQRVVKKGTIELVFTCEHCGRKYSVLNGLGMDSLARLIERDRSEVALRTWRNRYGHEFPVYAVINGQEIKYEH